MCKTTQGTPIGVIGTNSSLTTAQVDNTLKLNLLAHYYPRNWKLYSAMPISIILNFFSLLILEAYCSLLPLSEYSYLHFLSNHQATFYDIMKCSGEAMKFFM